MGTQFLIEKEEDDLGEWVRVFHWEVLRYKVQPLYGYDRVQVLSKARSNPREIISSESFYKEIHCIIVLNQKYFPINHVKYFIPVSLQ